MLPLPSEPHASWKAGEYVIDIDSDRGRYTCVVEVHPPTDPSVACPSGFVPPLSLGVGFMVGSGFWWVNLGESPTHAEMTVRRDGVELVKKELRPVYEDYYPNGRDCGYPCQVAHESIVVP